MTFLQNRARTTFSQANGYQTTAPRKTILAGAVTALALAVLPMQAIAAEKDLGQFKKWHGHTFTDAGANVCNMWSQPTDSKPKNVKRGEIYAFVTHRPSTSRFHEVSINMGYPLKPGSDVTLTIGSKKFKLYEGGSHAFAYDSDDRALVKAMRAGSKMIVQGVSKRGTKTTDVYSLSGFIKAHNAVNKACKARKL